jgi:hypothetical protein
MDGAAANSTPANAKPATPLRIRLRFAIVISLFAVERGTLAGTSMKKTYGQKRCSGLQENALNVNPITAL